MEARHTLKKWKRNSLRCAVYRGFGQFCPGVKAFMHTTIVILPLFLKEENCCDFLTVSLRYEIIEKKKKKTEKIGKWKMAP